MKFTDIFIRRPVLACVVSLMLLVVGLKAFYALPILEYPKTENAVVTITTVEPLCSFTCPELTTTSPGLMPLVTAT